MKTEIIDVHCHLLPGIDDGAKDMKDTIKALRTASEQGVKKIIMTPHFRPDMPILPEYVTELIDKVVRQAECENIDIDLLPGMECMYFSKLPSLLESKEVLTLAGSRYVLVEFPWDAPALHIKTGISKILEAGFVPVLAHYERYRSLEKKTVLEYLKRNGCLLQIDCDTVIRRYGLFKHNPFYKDIKNGLVDFLGSDCHASKCSEYCVNQALSRLKKTVTQDIFFDIVYRNPLNLISNNEIGG